jgi:hypothetical protein
LSLLADCTYKVLSTQYDRIPSLGKHGVTFRHVFLRRCGDVSGRLLLVLNGGFLDAVGGFVDLLGAGGGAGAVLLLLAAVAVDGLGLGFEAVDFGLGLGDVLGRVVSEFAMGRFWEGM